MSKPIENNRRFLCQCGGELNVIDSRNRNGDIRLRRYKCISCDNRYSSVEIVAYNANGKQDGRSLLASAALELMSNDDLMNEIGKRLANDVDSSQGKLFNGIRYNRTNAVRTR